MAGIEYCFLNSQVHSRVCLKTLPLQSPVLHMPRLLHQTPPGLCVISASSPLPPAVVPHPVVLAQAHSGGRQMGCLGSWKSRHPVMGRNVHVIFREFQEVFGSRHSTVRHKESIVCLPSPAHVPRLVRETSLLSQLQLERHILCRRWPVELQRKVPHLPVLTVCPVPSLPRSLRGAGASWLAWRKETAPPPLPGRLESSLRQVPGPPTRGKHTPQSLARRAL